MAGRRRREWFDDDEFWREMYPYLFPPSRMAAAKADAGSVVRLVKPRGKRVLDLCCGPGRHSIALAKRRFTVTGVDRTRYLLEKARAHARAAGVRVEWVLRDMRDFVRPDSFDLALSMDTSFGYFDDKREDLHVLDQVFESLRPGGAFVLDVGSKEWLARVFSSTTCQEAPDGSLLVQRHTIFDDWTRIRNEWILIRGTRAKRFTFHHTLYSAQELRDRLEQTGFRRVRCYGGFDGREYGPLSSRLVIVARKPVPKGTRRRK